MSATWAQFVRTGSPDGGSLGPWPRYTADERNTLVIDRTSRVVRDHKAERLDFWARQGSGAVPPLANTGVE